RQSPSLMPCFSGRPTGGPSSLMHHGPHHAVGAISVREPKPLAALRHLPGVANRPINDARRLTHIPTLQNDEPLRSLTELALLRQCYYQLHEPDNTAAIAGNSFRNRPSDSRN